MDIDWIPIVAGFLFVLLEGSSMWILNVTIRGIVEMNKGSICKLSGITALYTSFIFGCITGIFAPIVFGLYCFTGKEKYFIIMVFLSFVLVFAAVFLNMAVVYIGFSSEFKNRIGSDILKVMQLCDEFSLGVGFTAAGGFAVLLCSH